MIYPVVVRPEADVEIRMMYEYYGAISETLGSDAKASVIESVERIRKFPELYAPTYGKIRAIPIRRFPYILSYVFEAERISVLGLVHSSIPHETWNQRGDLASD